MGKIKIHELAKEININSKEILEVAEKLNLNAKSHLSSIDETDAQKIKEIINKKDVKGKTRVEEVKKEVKKDKEKAPVIIRREVVVNEQDTLKSNEQQKSKEDKKNNVGFIERKQNNEYNIVYREKNKKPLTVNELFGIKKDETAKAETEVKEVREEVTPKVDVEKVVVAEEVKEKTEINNNNQMSNQNRTQNFDNNRQQRDNNFRNNRDGQNSRPYNPNRNGQNPNYNRSNNVNNNYNNNNSNNNSNTNGNSNYNGNNNYNRYNNNNGNSNYSGNNNYNSNSNSNSNGRYNNQNGNNNYNNNRFNNNNGNSSYNNNNGNSSYNNNGRYNNNNGNSSYNNNNGNSSYNNNGRYNNNNGNSSYNNNNNNNNGRFNNNNGNNNGRFNNNNGNSGYNNNNNGRFNNNNGNNNGRFNNNQNGNGRFDNRRNQFTDDRKIEKNIKDIIATDIGEKEVVREYNKPVYKEKDVNKFEESRINKKAPKTKKVTAEFNEKKLKSLKQNDRLSNMFEDQEGGMLDYYDLTTQRGKKGRKKNSRFDEERIKQKIFKLTEIVIPETITVKDFAVEMKKTSADVIKKLLGYGVMATINNEVDFDTAFLIAQEFGINAIKKEKITEEDILFDDTEDTDDELVSRPPVVVVMGHVDHGKTSLLDAVKKTNVIEGEAGGITQHIGAYKVKINDREITFLDTPGHEAFTAMRARGAQITDIAILVVAANDGVMPQTIEAINHAKSAGIPIIVAVNKMDLPDANIEKVKQELMVYELVPEEWGGDTIFVPISAKKHENIDQLLEMVLLVADMKELKSNPHKQAKGVVIEARLDKAKGPIATMLVQRGTLDSGDTIVVGASIGRIRAMTDDKGRKVKKAGPSTPVEIMGLTEVPEGGETFYEVKDEKTAKHLIERRKRQAREKSMNSTSTVSLDDLFSQIEQGNLKTLNLIVKADVQGSVEAVKQAMEKLTNEEVKVKVIHSAAGAVTESDVTLAKVSKAIIIAFNVRPVMAAREMAEKEEIQIKQYSIIYQAIDDVEAAMKGMLDPKFEEKVIGTAEARQVFKVSNVGTIAGAMVTSGKVERNAGVRVIREEVVIHEGKLCSLKRFKDDAKEVSRGFECGIQIEGFNDIKEGDIIEVFILEEIKR